MTTKSRVVAITDELEYDRTRVTKFATGQVAVVAMYVTLAGSYVYFNVEPERVWWIIPGTRRHKVNKTTYRYWTFFYGKYTPKEIVRYLSKLALRDQMYSFDTRHENIQVVYARAFAWSGAMTRTQKRTEERHDGWYQAKAIPYKSTEKCKTYQKSTLTSIPQRIMIFGSIGVKDIRTRKRRLKELSLK